VTRDAAVDRGEHDALRRAAGGLTHPVAMLAVLLLVLNDHWWKTAYPSWVTGKLSDFAGLVFFPLLLQAVVELALAALRAYERPSMPLLNVMIFLTLVGFCWVKTTALGADAYGHVLGMARWPFHAVIAYVFDRPSPPIGHPGIVRDPTDLVTLVGLGATYVVGHARRSESVAK
jgi:hypothetical protein